MPRGRPALQLVTSAAGEDAPPASLDPGVAFRRHASYVAAVAYRLLGRDEEVDDTVQEVFLAAVRGLPALRDPGAVKGWLASVTVRVASRRLKRRRLRMFLRLDPELAYETVADPGASPEQRALLARIYRLLDDLPADQRVAWTLRYVEGERLEQVAVLCGCSLATAKRRIAAAASLLEDVLDV